MDQPRRYRNPPIQEAVAEFRFVPGLEWDLTIPGKLQAEFGDSYAGKPRQQNFVEVGLEAQGGKPSNLRYGEGLSRVQLVTDDGSRMVGVGPDVLSIHMMAPYQNPKVPNASGWEEFKSRIEDALSAYWKVAQPIGVNRLGVRYINRIMIPSEEIVVENYLKCAMPEVSGLPDVLTRFISRVEYSFEDGVRLILSQTSIEDAPQGHLGFILDLDLVWRVLKLSPSQVQ